MMMAKMNKNGTITLPREMKEAIDAFPGMKFCVSFSEGKITLKPYSYKCKVCEKDIPDGTNGDYCPECAGERSFKIY